MPKPPSDAALFLDGLPNRLSQPWRAFFAALAGAPGPTVNVPPAASPLTYAAPSAGLLVIQGGSITGLSILRGRSVVAVNPTLEAIPLAAGDQAVVDYATQPGLVFLPS